MGAISRFRSWLDRRAARRWETRAEQLEAIETRAAFPWTGPSTGAPRLSAWVSYSGIEIPAKLSFAASSLPELVCASAWSYAAISATARQISSLPPIVERRTSSGRWETDPSHPLNDFVHQPHGPAAAPPNWSWGQLLEVAAIHLLASPFGAAMRWQRLGRRPTGIWTLAPASLRPELDSSGVPVAWAYGSDRYSAAEVVHATIGHPTSYAESIPPLQAALKAIGIDQVIEARTEAGFKHRIAPGLHIEVTGIGGFNDDEEAKIKAKLLEGYSRASQEGLPLITGEGIKVNPAPQSMTQLGFEPARKFAKQAVLTAFGIPEQMLGASDRATYASVSEARLIWYDLIVFYLLGRLYDSLNRQLVAQLYPRGDVRIWYDVTETPVGLDLFNRKVDSSGKLVAQGVPFNVAARKLGLGLEVPGLDAPNQAAIAAGHAPPADEPTAPPADQPEPASDEAA